MVAVDGVAELFEHDYVRLVRSLSVAFDAESAADAVQEAFIAADRRWARVGAYDDPAGWVRRVAVNRLLNGRRNRGRRAEILAGIRELPDEDLTAEMLDLRRAVAQLSDAMRVTVCLRYLAGVQLDEIATVLGVTSGTVKSNLHDARIRLRQLLVEDPSG
jgi:RNA polymerase sigma-70 factor (ECF subfamily)